MLESDDVSARWVESRKTTDNFADGLLRTFSAMIMIIQDYKKRPLLVYKI